MTQFSTLRCTFLRDWVDLQTAEEHPVHTALRLASLRVLTVDFGVATDGTKLRTFVPDTWNLHQHVDAAGYYLDIPPERWSTVGATGHYLQVHGVNHVRVAYTVVCWLDPLPTPCYLTRHQEYHLVHHCQQTTLRSDYEAMVQRRAQNLLRYRELQQRAHLNSFQGTL